MTEEEIEGMKAYNAANARKTPEQPTLRDQFAMAATEADIELYMISDEVEDVFNDYRIMTQHVGMGKLYTQSNRTKTYTREQSRYRFADSMMEARK